MEDLGNYRKSYEKSELTETDIPESGMELFAKWFDEARTSKTVDEVNAMTVATIGLDGYPKSRIVLLKQFDQQSLIFYTNYNSEKGRAIAQNPHVCISFFWPTLERQIIIKGIASKTDASTSTAYFHSRPHGSQLGAKVSNQSEVIPNREFLESELKKLESQFADSEVPRPENWGGYQVKVQEIEFWQGRANRLHDRIRYQLKNDKWKRERLAP